MGRNWAMERDLIRPFNWPHSRRWIPRKWNPKTLRETTIYLDKNYNTAMFNREIILADSLSFSPYFPCFPRVFPFPPFPGSSKKSHEAWHHPPASSWLMETAVCKVLAGGSWEPGSISTCSHLRCWVIGGDFNGFQWILGAQGGMIGMISSRCDGDFRKDLKSCDHCDLGAERSFLPPSTGRGHYSLVALVTEQRHENVRSSALFEMHFTWL